MTSRKPNLKLSTKILISILILFVTGVVVADLKLKSVYDKVDKTDPYWNYSAILQQPYKYLKIDGGNVSNIIYQPGPRPSVRILNYWWDYKKGESVTAYVKNDTLHLHISNKLENLAHKNWMKSKVVVRLFGPQLLSVDGSDTNFELQKLKQNTFAVNLRGKSRLEVESYKHDFDSISVSGRDSSAVVFEMSPDIKGTKTMTFAHANVVLKDYSILDIGHARTADLKLNVTDTSAIVLSGKSIAGLRK